MIIYVKLKIYEFGGIFDNWFDLAYLLFVSAITCVLQFDYGNKLGHLCIYTFFFTESQQNTLYGQL